MVHVSESLTEFNNEMNIEPIVFSEPLILEDLVIETLAIDGICGVY